MKSRGRSIIAIICIIMMLTGCASMPPINLEQNEIIANYAARVVIRNSLADYSYKPVIKDKPDKSYNNTNPTEPQTDEDGNIIEEKLNYSGFADYLKLVRTVVTYKGCVITKEYPNEEDSLFVMAADDGYKFVVAEYNLRNDTNEDIIYSTPKEKPVIRLVLPDGSKAKSYANMFADDINNIKELRLFPGKETTVFVMFQIKEEIADVLEELEIVYLYNDEYIPLPTEPIR